MKSSSVAKRPGLKSVASLVVPRVLANLPTPSAMAVSDTPQPSFQPSKLP